VLRSRFSGIRHQDEAIRTVNALCERYVQQYQGDKEDVEKLHKLLTTICPASSLTRAFALRRLGDLYADCMYYAEAVAYGQAQRLFKKK
jgi:hypothetical protein